MSKREEEGRCCLGTAWSIQKRGPVRALRLTTGLGPKCDTTRPFSTVAPKALTPAHFCELFGSLLISAVLRRRASSILAAGCVLCLARQGDLQTGCSGCFVVGSAPAKISLLTAGCFTSFSGKFPVFFPDSILAGLVMPPVSAWVWFRFCQPAGRRRFRRLLSLPTPSRHLSTAAEAWMGWVCTVGTCRGAQRLSYEP